MTRAEVFPWLLAAGEALRIQPGVFAHVLDVRGPAELRRFAASYGLEFRTVRASHPRARDFRRMALFARLVARLVTG